jgi:hypothetical protein
MFTLMNRFSSCQSHDPKHSHDRGTRRWLVLYMLLLQAQQIYLHCDQSCKQQLMETDTSVTPWPEAAAFKAQPSNAAINVRHGPPTEQLPDFYTPGTRPWFTHYWSEEITLTWLGLTLCDYISNYFHDPISAYIVLAEWLGYQTYQRVMGSNPWRRHGVVSVSRIP